MRNSTSASWSGPNGPKARSFPSLTTEQRNAIAAQDRAKTTCELARIRVRAAEATLELHAIKRPGEPVAAVIRVKIATLGEALAREDASAAASALDRLLLEVDAERRLSARCAACSELWSSHDARSIRPRRCPTGGDVFRYAGEVCSHGIDVGEDCSACDALADTDPSFLAGGCLRCEELGHECPECAEGDRGER